MREITNHLLAAERPLVLAGAGVVQAGATDALSTLVEQLHIPVVTTLGGKTSLPGLHAQNMGVIGRYASTVSNQVAAEADCVLVVGSRLGELATNGYRLPNSSATILRIDADPRSFCITYPENVSLAADARLALDALCAETEGKSLSSAGQRFSASAFSRIVDWRNALKKALQASCLDKLLSPLLVMDSMARYSQEITVVVDTGYMAAWTGVLYPTARAASYFRSVGSLGWALPGAMGVQIARKEKVVCVTGDGGLGYHFADLETAARLRIPLVVVCLNNGCLAFEYHLQKYLFENRILPEVNDFSDADYARAATALGVRGVRVETIEQFQSAFADAIAAQEPVLLDVIVDREAFPPVSNYDNCILRTL